MEEKLESPYRVRVNLSRFFDDERSLCYMSVQGDRRVRWLQRRLRRLFALPRRVCLLSCGHLLPPDEPLSLLQPDDPVDVIPLSIGCNWRLDEKSTKSTISEFHHQEDGHQENEGNVAMMSDTNEDNEITVNINKKEKHSCVSDCAKSNMNNDVCYSMDDIDGLEIHKEDENLKQIKQRALALLETFQEQSLDQCNVKTQRIIHKSENQDGPRRIRRRVRRRRPRNILKTSATTIPADNTSYTEQIHENHDKITEHSEIQSSISSHDVSNTTTSPLVLQSLSLYSDPVPAMVVQNSKVTPRAARLIYPIGEQPCIEPTLVY